MAAYNPKERMLNAYRGRFSDRYPVAPEFWYYIPARVLGVNMVAFQREIPFWQALQTTFKRYQTEGWGIVEAASGNPAIKARSSFIKISDNQYRLNTQISCRGKTFEQIQIFDRSEPSWTVEYPVKYEEDIPIYFQAALSPEITFEFETANQAYRKVDSDYLLELSLGVPFFDFIASFTGFEKAVFYFANQNPTALRNLQERYTESRVEFVRKACRETMFESFFIGCSYSNNSLLGPKLWRQWDKPYLKAVVEEVHRQGRLLHLHLHGKSMATVPDLAELGIDCVCPFERPPGGDIDGLSGLHRLAASLGGKVTMNGNVHTVEALIRGTPEVVRGQVREIKTAFLGEPRLIIGTGDQVGLETPEANILAMIAEAKEFSP